MVRVLYTKPVSVYFLSGRLAWGKENLGEPQVRSLSEGYFLVNVKPFLLIPAGNPFDLSESPGPGKVRCPNSIIQQGVLGISQAYVHDKTKVVLLLRPHSADGRLPSISIRSISDRQSNTATTLDTANINLAEPVNIHTRFEIRQLI